MNEGVDVVGLGAAASWLVLSTLAVLSTMPGPLHRASLQYGKLADLSQRPPRPGSRLSTALGLLLSPSVPRSYFAHYYVVAALAAGAVAHRAVALDHGVSPRALLLLLALLQGLRRLAESWLVERPSARCMGLAVYAGGLLHYLLVPATLWAAGARSWAGPAAAAAHAAGAALFAFGSWKQFTLHRILASQRSEGRAYGVPDADWFATITCPHYTAEVLIYAALVGPPLSGLLGTGAGPGSAAGAAAAALLLGWVATNLAINATRHRRWYLLRFPRQQAFLRRRAAIFPGVL